MKEARYACGRAGWLVAGLNPTSSLDVGAANGGLVQELLDHGVDAWGADASPYICGVAAGGPLSERLVLADVCDLPFPSLRFDVVTAYHVLEHVSVSKIGAALRELGRVAKAWIVIEVPTLRTMLSSVDHTHVSLLHDYEWLGMMAAELPDWRRSQYRRSTRLRPLRVVLRRVESGLG